MQTGEPVERILRWRLALAEATAPPPPSATRLLALARPWWEQWPARYRAQVERLLAMPLAYGYAMVAPDGAARGHALAVLIARGDERETYARVLYVSVRDGRLRMRIELDAAPAGEDAPGDVADVFEATFVGDADDARDVTQPLLAGTAELAQNGEYRLEAELPDALAVRWTTLRATDRMPFRLILRPPWTHA
ncbi:MAG TPA: hypothetical protein VEZ47_09225 [Gemmatirosa sp.]|jgi:hypothetical protein|nr:hypothetical protein [Gemmatirosa sp.]